MKIGVPISLRSSAHLLFGVVRVYSKKVDQLLSDCNNVQIRLLKLCSMIPLLRNINTMAESQAAINTITLPDNFHLDELDLDFEIG
jgi:cohesin complex subunit SCC1